MLTIIIGCWYGAALVLAIWVAWLLLLFGVSVFVSGLGQDEIEGLRQSTFSEEVLFSCLLVVPPFLLSVVSVKHAYKRYKSLHNHTIS